MDISEIKRLLQGKGRFSSKERESALYIQELCDRHISGEKWLETIKKIDGLHNDKDIEIMKEVASPQTVGHFKKFRNQFKKIFRADGFNSKVVFNDDYTDLADEASNWLGSKFQGVGLRSWMQEVWSQLNDERPNDIVLLDYPEEQSVEPDIIATIIPLEALKEVEWDNGKISTLLYLYKVVDTKLDNGSVEKKKVYRYINSFIDALYIETVGGELTAVMNPITGLPDVINNRLGYVPAISAGQIVKNTATECVRVNQYYYGLLQADKMQGRCNDHDVSVKKHAFPWMYAYPIECGTCDGTGNTYDDHDVKQVCHSCKGSRKQMFDLGKAAEGIRIPLPQKAGLSESLQDVPRPVAYVERDNETISQQRELKQDVKDEIELSVLGVVGLIDRKAQSTATEELINYQPVLDRFYDHSKVAQRVESFIGNTALRMRYNTTVTIDRLGVVEYVERFSKYVVKYGTTYSIKSEQEYVKEYKEGKEAGLPEHQLKEINKRIIMSRYENDYDERERQLLLLELTPMSDKTLKEMQDLGYGTAEQLGIRFYFNDIIAAIEREEGMPITSVGTVDEIKAKMIVKYQELTYVEGAEEGGGDAAKEKLRATVGGVTALVAINAAVSSGDMSEKAAETILIKTFGYSAEDAAAMIEAGKNRPAAEPGGFGGF